MTAIYVVNHELGLCNSANSQRMWDVFRISQLTDKEKVMVSPVNVRKEGRTKVGQERPPLILKVAR
jgi:hypothetical protein